MPSSLIFYVSSCGSGGLENYLSFFDNLGVFFSFFSFLTFFDDVIEAILELPISSFTDV